MFNRAGLSKRPRQREGSNLPERQRRTRDIGIQTEPQQEEEEESRLLAVIALAEFQHI
jgi:hypothetical protein